MIILDIKKLVFLSLLFQLNCFDIVDCKKTLVTTVTSKGPIKKLGRFRIYRKWITISGHSSGAAYSNHALLAHSKLFAGAGILSGLYYQYNGVPSKPFILGLHDKDPPGVGIKNSIEYLHYYDKNGLISKLANVRNKKIFVYAGTEDEFHGLDQRPYATQRTYEPLLKDPVKQLKIVVKFAPHAPPTGKCTKKALAAGFECQYDGFLDMFRFLYNWRLREPGNWKIPIRPLQKFDQLEFLDGLRNHSMADYGYIYIPTGCTSAKKCLLHIFLHGCWSDNYALQTLFQLEKVYQLAELNNMIVVSPVVKASKINPQGCWDFVGFSGSKYATKEGPQMKVIRRIIHRLAGL